MAVKVLIVDDSGFFRRRLKDLINSSADFEVVGTADNGRVAIEKTKELKPDVITMDYEMPVMDGITAVRKIMAETPTPILMFSSMTFEGAQITLDSLDAGAVDYLPKNFSEIANNSEGLRRRLFDSLFAVSRSRGRVPSTMTKPEVKTATKRVAQPTAPPVEKPAAVKSTTTRTREAKRNKTYDVVAIGTSTGGPVALQEVLRKLPRAFKLPMVLIQHMPATFTPAFAERLNSICQIEVREAMDGDYLKPGVALLAPGGQQMMVGKRGIIKILKGDDRLHYKPSVDVTFGSTANVFGDQVLAIVLTGMGADGRDGARLLKRGGATVWAQDEASSTIYGMPMAVAKAGLADEILALKDIGLRLKEVT